MANKQSILDTAANVIKAIELMHADAKAKPRPTQGEIPCPACTNLFRYRISGPRSSRGRCTFCDLQFIS